MSHITRGSKENKEVWKFKEEHGYYPWENEYEAENNFPIKKRVKYRMCRF